MNAYLIPNRIYAFLCIIGLFVILPSFSFAEEELPAPSISELEKISLPGSETLDAGIYHSSSRKAITHLISNTDSGKWIPINNLINALLLTSAETSTIVNDIEVTEQNNLFSIRLDALMRRGVHKQAFQLYTTISETVQYDFIARLGVTSMLLNKEKALACLETKTLYPQFEEIDFWVRLNQYCSATIAETSVSESQEVDKLTILDRVVHDPDYKVTYSSGALDGISLFDLGILTSEDRLVFPKQSQETYKNIDPRYITPMITQSGTSTDEKFLLMLSGVEAGIYSSQDLEEFYGTLIPSDNRPMPKANASVQELIHLYKKFKDDASLFRNDESKEKFLQLFSHLNPIAFIVFLSEIENFTPGEDITLEDTKKLLTLFLYDNRPVPINWHKDLSRLTFEDKTLETLAQQLFYISFMMSKSAQKNDIPSSLEELDPYLLFGDSGMILKNIIENIDRSTNNSDKVQYIYENDFDLKRNKSYTMPPYIVLDVLRQSSKNHNTGVTILLSNALLSGIEPGELYPELLGDLAVALDKTGLKQVSRQLVAQALLNEMDK